MEAKDYYTLKTLAAKLNVSGRTLKRWMEKGIVPPAKLSHDGMKRWTRKQIAAWDYLGEWINSLVDELERLRMGVQKRSKGD